MSTYFNCEVDTKPMAAELATVSHNVRGTTNAVVTMQSAVIAAENASADKVCTNVNRGFFSLIQSQISQKIANKQSRVEALLLKLNQQTRSLLNIKGNMEREYGRIAARYLRIFTSINRELESRIQQVDQPVFDLVNRHMMASSNRMNSLTGWISTSQIEGVSLSQRILVSNMKNDAQKALEQTTDFLTQIGEQRKLTGQILLSLPHGNDDNVCQMPVMVCESVNDALASKRVAIKLPDLLSGEYADSVSNTIRNIELPWQDKELDSSVSDAFLEYVDASSASSRVKEMTKKLYMSSNIQTL